MYDLIEKGISVTENGAIGYKTTSHGLLDLNFSASSMRLWEDYLIEEKMDESMRENVVLTVAWMFFLRDIRQGMGERKSFRVMMHHLCDRYPKIALAVIRFIPEYGRWDDLISLFDEYLSKDILTELKNIVRNQIYVDLSNMQNGKNVSLLGKWMPSENASSEETKKRARQFRNFLNMSSKEYRKMLSALRDEIQIVESKMSAGEWNEIDYASLPSRAAMIYSNSFINHDAERYMEYMENVKSGDEKINAAALFPYEIINRYGNSWGRKQNTNLELLWSNLPRTERTDSSTIVVVDGSGSMDSRIGAGSATASDVAKSIGILMSETLTGPYENAFITFSEKPRLVRFKNNSSLYDKIRVLEAYDDPCNTNIEAVFDLILDTAVANCMKDEDLPKNVLIISDMEFDACTERPDVNLFRMIEYKYASHNYNLPKLTFWNVCSRTNTIPIVENGNGVALVSGFSQNIFDMVFSGRTDPWDVLLDKLTSDRYDEIIREVERVHG